MEDTTTTADKRIVEQLNYGAKTAKRVGWEAWEFSIEGPHLIRVTNASYGFEKADHSYLIGVEERDGLCIPSECECPADKYNEEYACKHRVACATIGGPVVLQAAVECPTPTHDTEGTDSTTLDERLRADGGVTAETNLDDNSGLIAADSEECDCAELSDDFPCFDCYLAGEKELPE